MLDTQRIIPATRLERTPNFDMRFPPLPRTVAEVSKLVSAKADIPDTPLLVQVVNSDPVVAASVLRRINSAFYGVRRRVGDIQKAVFLLGFDEVCDIVLTSGMMKLRDVLNTDEQTRIFEEIMRMSVGTAAYAKKLATYLDLHEQNSAFTTGLLHTVGRLVLLYNRPDDYEALWCTNDYGFAPTVTSEQIIFGTDHAELGALAADSWHLPEFIVKVVRFYLTPGHIEEHNLRILALTLSVAATATERLCIHPGNGDGRAFEATAALHALARNLQFSSAELIDLIESNRDEINSYSHAMVDA
jgi:HD-like signal output (HDOD) protein